jgi:hypothetical protein
MWCWFGFSHPKVVFQADDVFAFEPTIANTPPPRIGQRGTTILLTKDHFAKRLRLFLSNAFP